MARNVKLISISETFNSLGKALTDLDDKLTTNYINKPFPKFSYWCIKIDEAQNIGEIQDVDDLFMRLKKNYPLIEVRFYVEHRDNKFFNVKDVPYFRVVPQN